MAPRTPERSTGRRGATQAEPTPAKTDQKRGRDSADEDERARKVPRIVPQGGVSSSSGTASSSSTGMATLARRFSRALSLELNQRVYGQEGEAKEPQGNPTSCPKFKDASVRYVRGMLFETMRDGELSSSERKMIFWAVILLAQSFERAYDDAGRDLKVPMPRNIKRYLGTQRDTIMNFLTVVHQRLREDAFETPETTVQWVLNMSHDTPEGSGPVMELLSKLLVEFNSFVFGKAARHIGISRLVAEKITASELLTMLEPREEPDVYKMFGLFGGFVLDSVSPLCPSRYLFRERLLDSYLLWTVDRGAGWVFTGNCLQFFTLSLLYCVIQQFLAFLWPLLKVRTLLCSGHDVPVLGPQVIQRLQWIVTTLTEWEPDHWLLGCSREEGLPEAVAGVGARLLGNMWALLALFSVTFALVMRTPSWGRLMKLALTVALVWLARGAVMRTTLAFLLNYIITCGVATFLSKEVEIADEIVQPKLLRMSLKLGSEAKEQLERASGARR